MLLLVIGLAVFFAAHLFPWSPALRRAAVGRLGELGYKAVFGIVSLAGLALAGHGYASAEGAVFWTAPSFGKTLALMLVTIAFVLLVSAYIGSNVKHLTPHPMLWGVGAWALAHVINNGDVPSLVLFGSFLIYVPAAIWSANRRGAARMAKRLPLWRDFVCAAIGLVLAMGFARFHETLFGVAIVPAA